MNIYKRKSDGMILCSPDGDGKISGFDFLGSDETVTESNKRFVTGFSKKKAVIDSDKIDSYNKSIQSNQAKKRLTEIDQEYMSALRKGETSTMNSLKAEALSLESKL